MREPSGFKVSAPVVNFVLRVGHAQDGQILLDSGGSGGSIRKNSHVDLVSEGCVEVPLIAGLGAIGEETVETDVVGGSVLPSVPWCERHRGFLLALQGHCRT